MTCAKLRPLNHNIFSNVDPPHFFSDDDNAKKIENDLDGNFFSGLTKSNSKNQIACNKSFLQSK